MMGEKEKLEKHLEELKREDITILEFEELRNEKVKKTFPKFKDPEWFENLTEEEKGLFKRIGHRTFYKLLTVYENYIDKWNRGLFIPNEEELKNLKLYQKNFESKLIFMYDELKKETPSLALRIEEEKEFSKEKKKVLDKLLENDKYREKAELLRKISELENKLEKDPNNQDYKRELSLAKKELEMLRRAKEKENEKEKENGFPTKLVVGLSIGAVVMLLVVVLFSWFNRRN